MAKRKSRKERQKVSARRRVDEHKTGFTGTTFRLPEGMELFKLKAEGIKRVDVVPFTAGKGNPYAEEGQLHFERTFYIHRDIGPDNNSYICNKKTNGEPCPICEHRAEMLQDADADEDLIAKLAPKERQLWYLVDLGDRDKGVQLFECSFHLFGKQLDFEIQNQDEDEEFDLFADPEDGMSLKLGVEEKSMGKIQFYSVESIGFKPRKTPLDPELYEELEPLDNLLVFQDYDELKRIFLEVEDDEDVDEDEQPAKKSAASKKKTTGKSAKKSPSTKKKSGTKPAKEEDVDEDEDDWDDEDGEEEEPAKPTKKAPAKKKPTAKKKPKPEPEPEEDEDEDDWEDEDGEDDWDEDGAETDEDGEDEWEDDDDGDDSEEEEDEDDDDDWE